MNRAYVFDRDGSPWFSMCCNWCKVMSPATKDRQAAEALVAVHQCQERAA